MKIEEIRILYKTCPFCHVNNEIGHIKELPKPTRKIIVKTHGTKHAYVVFCPRCESMGIVKSE
jgi:hypothetical protein